MVRPPETVLILPRFFRRFRSALFFEMLSASFPVRLRRVVVTISVIVDDGFTSAIFCYLIGVVVRPSNPAAYRGELGGQFFP